MPAPPLTCQGVYDGLLALGRISGDKAVARKTSKMVHMMRSAKGSEIKWVVRTLSANTRAGVSLEATVLPSLGAAYVWHRRRTAVEAEAAAAASGAAAGGGSGGTAGTALAAKRRKLAGGTSTGADAAKDFTDMKAAIRRSFALRPHLDLLGAAGLELQTLT